MSFYDTLNADAELSLDNNGGTFFETGYTTEIPFDVFAFCMAHSELGDMGFYIYSYVKYMNLFCNNKKKPEDYSATFKTIANKIGSSENTIQLYMKALRKYNLISTSHNIPYFSPGFKQDERKASSHFYNDFNMFTTKEVEYDKLSFKSKKYHLEQVKEKKEEESKLIKFELEKLPF